eukprot:scaffold1529_cov86-Cylindrotheca_fusiformis.AAC.9
MRIVSENSPKRVNKVHACNTISLVYRSMKSVGQSQLTTRRVLDQCWPSGAHCWVSGIHNGGGIFAVLRAADT